MMGEVYKHNKSYKMKILAHRMNNTSMDTQNKNKYIQYWTENNTNK